MAVFERSVDLAAPVEALFDWHLRADAFERLTPPWEPVTVEQAPERLADGARAVLRVGRWPLRLRWVAEHRDVRRPHGFVDEQLSGPFARWVHEHRMEPRPGGGSRLTDHVEYALPLEPLSRWVAGGLVRRRLERMFAYRHQVMRDELGALSGTRDRPRGSTTAR